MENKQYGNNPQIQKTTPAASIRQMIKKPDNCSKCGFCLNSCPVYREYLVETASPRGKIQLSRQILDGKLDLSQKMKEILSRCLMCGSCSVACPSGVQSAQLFSGMRWLAVQRLGLDWQKKIIYQVLANKWVVATSARFAAWADRHFKPLVERGISKRLPIAGVPPFTRWPFNETVNPVLPAVGKLRTHVLYFHGCATNYLYADIGNAVTRVLTRMGVEVHTPEGQGCCGIPIILSGDRALSVKCIRLVVERFSRPDVDAVIVDCATCGSALRNEYVPVLTELKAMGYDVDDDLIAKAELLAEKTRDIMEFITAHQDWLPDVKSPQNTMKVTYHDPCHLSKAQSVGPKLRELFYSLPGIEFIEMEEADVCCGGGGVFQVDHPEISAAITSKKLKNISRTGADALATGCPGCRITIGSQRRNEHLFKILHPVQLVERLFNPSSFDFR